MSSERQKFRAIKGVRDILPAESALWNRVEQTARETFATYNFQEIRLPILEEYDLFVRSVGEHSDIVSKELLISWDAPLDQWDASRASLSRHFEKDRLDMFTARWADLAFRHGEKDFFVHFKKKLSDPPSPEQVQKYVEEFRKSLDNSPDWREFRNYVAHFSRLDEWTKIALRPEATASVCRAYIEHGMYSLPGNVKLYCIGAMFRRERPQKGRFRQFYQIDAEVLGQSDAPAIDAEVIEMLMEFFERCELTGTTLYINSIGCQECRPAYVAKLRKELMRVEDKLGPDSQRRIETNPLRVLDSKLPEEQAIIEKLPRIADSLCEACKTHFAQVQDELKQRGIAYEVNWRLVRGLDYYMRTTFEITASGLGAQNAICGGGRYDGLVELLGGPPTKGIGFAIGTDRVILALQEAGKGETRSYLDVFVAWMGASAYPLALRLARRLRTEKLSVEVPAEDMRFKKSIGLADKLGARYALIIGGDEVASGSFTLKRLADAEQKKLSESELLEYLKAVRTG